MSLYRRALGEDSAGGAAITDTTAISANGHQFVTCIGIRHPFQERKLRASRARPRPRQVLIAGDSSGARRIDFFLPSRTVSPVVQRACDQSVCDQSVCGKPLPGRGRGFRQKTAAREGSGLSCDGRRMRNSNATLADSVRRVGYDTCEACRCLALPARTALPRRSTRIAPACHR